MIPIRTKLVTVLAAPVILCLLAGCPHRQELQYLRARHKLVITDDTVSSRPTVVVQNRAGPRLESLRARPTGNATDAANELSGTVKGVLRPSDVASIDVPGIPHRVRVQYRDHALALHRQATAFEGKTLAGTELFRQVMAASDAALTEREYAAPSEVTAPEAFEFARVAGDVLDRAAALGATLEHSEVDDAEAVLVGGDRTKVATITFDLIAKTYLQAYFKGKFVNRRGVKLAKPKLEGNKLDNATIAALETVLLEAWFDFHYRERSPVLYDLEHGYVPLRLEFPFHPFYVDGYEYRPVERYHTEENATPSAAKFVGVVQLVKPPAQNQAGEADPGVTALEYEVVRLLAGLSGEVKKQVSKLVFQLFGGVEISFVFGGHFSVGDNETLATMVVTLIEVAAARTMEFKWKEFFHQFRYHVDNDGKPVLTAVDRQTNAAGPLFLEDWEQDAWLLVLKHHKLISQLIGD